jgi:hypothetical protein
MSAGRLRRMLTGRLCTWGHVVIDRVIASAPSPGPCARSTSLTPKAHTAGELYASLSRPLLCCPTFLLRFCRADRRAAWRTVLAGCPCLPAWGAQMVTEVGLQEASAAAGAGAESASAHVALTHPMCRSWSNSRDCFTCSRTVDGPVETCTSWLTLHPRPCRH